MVKRVIMATREFGERTVKVKWVLPAYLMIGIIAFGLAFSVKSYADRQREAADDDRAIAEELCAQQVAWQQATIEGRRADVRLIEADMRSTRDELADAELALADAERVVGGDEPPSEAEAFFLGVFGRDVDRVETKLAEHLAEHRLRLADLAALEQVALESCPPVVGDA